MYRFKFWPYQRQFRQPLHTNHGIWSVREGIILQLQDASGATGWGEIAPLSWFGSETLEQALTYCGQLPHRLTAAAICSIPATLPACQFGFGTAWEALKDKQTLTPAPNLTFCGLLPTGKAALEAWPSLWRQGYRTLKWKIGIAPAVEEIQLFQQLLEQLPPATRLRLDANGGLNWESAQQWLEICDRHTRRIEYLEQPLPVEQLEAMLALSTGYATSIALDESVATLQHLQACYQKGWRGIFVVKPAIAGYPHQLRKFCQTYAIDVVFSSVFETDIGRQAGLNLAQNLSTRRRAVGFGVNHWFQALRETEECNGIGPSSRQERHPTHGHRSIHSNPLDHPLHCTRLD